MILLAGSVVDLKRLWLQNIQAVHLANGSANVKQQEIFFELDIPIAAMQLE